MEAGTATIFPTILDAMKSDCNSDKRCMLNERRTVSLIYTLMYSQSQQCNWFQVASARTLEEERRRRSRVLVHDYQQNEIQDIQAMRSIANCKLVDCIKLPLKSLENFHSALDYLQESGLSVYINKFLVPFVGDWPCQLFARQVVFNQGIVSKSYKSKPF